MSKTPAADKPAPHERRKLGGLVANLAQGAIAGMKKSNVAPTVVPSAFGSAPSLNIDIMKFSEENLDIDTYMNQLLHVLPNEEAVHQLYRSMNDCKELAASDIQRNVFSNYNEFVIISKEISKLETEMLVMRNYLGELKEVQDDLKQFAGTEEEMDVHQGSKADDPLASPAQKAAALAVMMSKQKAKEEEANEAKANQIKALYQNIEGLQKLLPEVKERYLVRDGAKTKCWEVNPNNYKVKDQCHLFIFNDNMVVAQWKRNIVTGKSRLVAEQLMNLSEIGFVDMRDSPDVTNAFKIMKHPDNFIYRTDTVEDKRAILNAIKRITDEILAQKRKEKEALKEKKAGISPAASPSRKAFIQDEKKQDRTLKDDLSPTDYRWLVELPDELDVLIAHRDFDAAVTQIEKETPRVQALRLTVDERTAALAKMITLDLGNPVATKHQVQDNIDRLLRLGLGDKARDIFLTARTGTIRHRVKQLRFSGDVVSYISDLAEVTFRLIRNTCDWYGGSFRDTSMASGFMKWVQDEVEYFTDTLRRQIFDSRQSFTVIAEALVCTVEQCQQLREVGLDLTFLLDRIILSDISHAVDVHAAECDENIVEWVKNDTLLPKEESDQFFEDRGLRFDFPVPTLSQSGYELYEVLTDFGFDIGPLMSLPMYIRITQVLGRFFNTYMDVISVRMDEELTNAQYASILFNTTFLIVHVFPRVKAQLQERFGRPIPELDKDYLRHTESIKQLEDKFVQKSRIRLIKNEYNFAKLDYSNSASILDTTLPTDAMMKCVAAINQMFEELDHPILDVGYLVTQVLEVFFDFLCNDGGCWETIEKKPRRFGYGGVQTLILDIHFLLKVTDKYINDAANANANGVCEHALRAYFSQNKDLSIPLKTQEWYDGRVAETMRKYGRNFSALLA